MTKHILLFPLLCCVAHVGVVGQSQTQPWNCNVRTNKNLICLLPVATYATTQGTQNSPASAFNSSFATQLSNLPIVSSASGIGVTLTATGGVVTSEENLGPILTDRAETIGRHHLYLGFFYQRFRFNSIDGTSLNHVPLVIESGPSKDVITQYTQQTNNINFNLDQYVGVVTFGVTNKTDVSMVIPIERVSIGVGTVATEYFFSTNGTPQGVSAPMMTYVSGSYSGIGDVIANVKNRFVDGERFKFAAGMLLRFPSGNALNYTGSGAFGFNPYAVLSYQWKVSPHARIGYQWNTSTVLIPSSSIGGSSQLPGGFQYDVGADWSPVKRLTIAGDFMGSQYLNTPALSLGTTKIPTQPMSLEEPSLEPVSSSYQVNYFSIGAKYKPVKELILYANALFQLNDVGLRSNIVPLVGISYKFGK